MVWECLIPRICPNHVLRSSLCPLGFHSLVRISATSQEKASLNLNHLKIGSALLSLKPRKALKSSLSLIKREYFSSSCPLSIVGNKFSCVTSTFCYFLSSLLLKAGQETQYSGCSFTLTLHLTLSPLLSFTGLIYFGGFPYDQ